MSTGPTTVGSIVARLRLDTSDWSAKLKEAGVQADELGRKNPSIKVDADVAEALAKLEQVRAASEAAGGNTTSTVTERTVTEASSTGPASGSVSAGAAGRVDAVAAAERRLEAAERQAANSASIAYIANERLNALQERRGYTELQLTAATEALARADRNAEASEVRLLAANEALAASERTAADTAARLAAAEEVRATASQRAARAALEEATANDVVTASGVRANKTSVSRMGMIGAAIAMLLPMAAPLAGFSAGVAGGFALMGVSGIVAIKGIHDEMIKGTALGNEYRIGLKGLTTDLNALGHTSAVGMLDSFTKATQTVSTNMPALNREIGLFTGYLGRSSVALFNGAINGLKVLEPLLITGAQYVERLSRGFEAWSQDGGMQKFGNYAMAVLPGVAKTLGDLTFAVMNVLTALAPFGTVMLGVVDGIANFLTVAASTGPVFAAIVGGATSAFLAFKLWGVIAPMLATVTEAAAIASGSITLLGASIQIATGPIGWIIAGVAALATILAVSSAATQNATQATQEYTAAVSADTGAVGANVKAKIAQMLSDSGAYEAAKKLGISARTLTQDVLGNAAAHKQVTTAVDGAKRALVDNMGATDKVMLKTAALAGAADTVTSSVNTQKNAIRDQIDAYNNIQDALGGTTIKTEAQLRAQKSLAASYGMTVPQYLAAAASQKQTAAQLLATTQQMFMQNDAAGLLTQALDKLNGKNISAAAAQNSFDSAIANSDKHINAAGKEINRATTSLDGMSAAAVQNRTELTNQTSAAMANAEAMKAQTDENGKFVFSGEDVRQKLIAMKKQIVENAVAHGEDRAAVQAYVDAIYSIPATVPPVRIDADTAAALAKLGFLQAQLDALNKNITIRVDTINTNAGNPNIGFGLGSGHATGGTIGGSSGTVQGRGSAASDGAGLFRLARGEEVISNIRGQADANRPLLKAINAGASLPVTGFASQAPSGNVSVSIINKAGAALGDLIDLHIETASGRRKINLSTGLQRVAY